VIFKQLCNSVYSLESMIITYQCALVAYEMCYFSRGSTSLPTRQWFIR